jgi:hypothetical protein
MKIESSDPRASDREGYVPPPRYGIQHRSTLRYLDYCPSVSTLHTTTADAGEAASYATLSNAEQERKGLGPFADAYQVVEVKP